MLDITNSTLGMASEIADFFADTLRQSREAVTAPQVTREGKPLW
jgi:hypothetical protein